MKKAVYKEVIEMKATGHVVKSYNYKDVFTAKREALADSENLDLTVYRVYVKKV